MLKHVFKGLNRNIAGAFFIGAGSLLGLPTRAQTSLPLADLSAFKTPGKSWVLASDVSTDFSRTGNLNVQQGTGVLVNLPDKNNGTDLYTMFEHGDMDLELDFILPKGANSGIYLQGRYELQLMDSWGVTTPTAGDNGAIYQRWDDGKPEGQKGYDGHAPRMNVSKAPGLWQHLKVSFQAPRFDASGKKIENARILLAQLNGVTIHEDLELTGPTRGAMRSDERPTGPLRIQGDHGSIALKNIRVTAFDKPRPQLSDLRYTVYKGRFADTMNLAKLPPEAQGPLGNLSASAIEKVPSEYFIRYTGNIKIAEAGAYTFNVQAPGGRGVLRINNQLVNGGNRNAFTLPAGNLPFELVYTKNQDWTNRSVALAITGPGVREFLIGDPQNAGNNADPIYVDAPVNSMLRSFMDIPGQRIVHAISIGSPQQVHYTYDLDKGALVQTWRGGFLDATPMWYSRGDGSSRPRGAVQFLGKPVFAIAKLNAAGDAWPADTTGSGYLPKGYTMDKTDLPTFRYFIYGAKVADAITPLALGEGVSRTITIEEPASNLYVRLAEGSTIEPLRNDLYVIDGRSYYLRLDDAGGAKAIIRDAAGKKELIIPVQRKLSYSIIY